MTPGIKMEASWDENISSFIELAHSQEVRMIMVGSGAMNFYRYNSPSIGLDFWIEATSKNLSKILSILKELGSEIVNFPVPGLDRNQNFSIQFSPSSLNLELITNFLVDKSFSWAYDDSIETSLQQNPNVKWRVLALEDLIDSKTKSLDPRDLMDLQELKRLNGDNSQ